MAEKLPMLALSPTMEEGTISHWLKKEGDVIHTGETICEVETDKAVMEYQSMVEGTLLKILSQEGEKVKIGDPIAIVGEPNEDISSLLTPQPISSSADSSSSSLSPHSSPLASSTQLPPSVSKTPSTESKTKIRATPAARGLAAEYGIDLSSIKGSGPHGRILLRDIQTILDNSGSSPKSRSLSVLSHQLSSSPLPSGQRIPLSSHRKVIAERLSKSMFTAPHYALRIHVIADELMQLRERINSKSDKKLSLNAFLIKLTAQVLSYHPFIHAVWADDSIIIPDSIDIGLAVAIEDGLLTPIVRDCLHKTIKEIDQELQSLIVKAHEKKLKPEEFTGATFTITNLGSFGIDEFTAIINPPGSAILAVGAIRSQPWVHLQNQQIEIKKVMVLTLNCDHRVIDGAVGAKFLQDLKNTIEEPSLALL